MRYSNHLHSVEKLAFIFLFLFAKNALCASGEVIYRDGQTNIEHPSITQACEHFKNMLINGMKPVAELCNEGTHSCPSDDELYAARVAFEKNPYSSFGGASGRFYFSFWNKEDKELGQCHPLQEWSTNFYVECKEPKEHILSPGVCAPYLINIEGPSSTEALPAMVGPIKQDITIKHGDRPLEGVYASIVIHDASTNNIVSHAGHTDNSGSFSFLYIPPYLRSTVVDISASCAQCTNIATKAISVYTGVQDNNVNPEALSCKKEKY